MRMMMMLSRTIRRVPMDWRHPEDARGYQPMHDGSYADALAKWQEGKARWDRGEYDEWTSEESKSLTYEEYAGEPPDPAYYMPTFPSDALLGICMYEEVSEGTPISPVFPDTEDGRYAMAAFLAGNRRGSITDGMSVDEWRAIIDGGLGMKDLHTGDVEVHT